MADIAPDLVNPHEESEACGGTHCHSHGLDESDVGAWRVCGECGHVYRSPEDLRRVWADEVGPAYAPGPAPEVPPADEILACPLCSHDW